MKKFDVFVIGTGVAGQTVAEKCVEAGLTVGIADSKPFGGTCPLRGCDPKKVLIDASKVIHAFNCHHGHGVKGQAHVNWQELMAFKKTFLADIPENTEEKYLEKGISYYHAQASFTGENTLMVGEVEVQADKIVLATGAMPMPLDIPGEELTLCSEDFLSLETLPATLLFIGGGYVAFEFAHLAARCGASVTIVDVMDAPLGNFEQDIVAYLVKATEELGVKIVLGTEVTAISQAGSGKYTVTGKCANGTREFTVDAVFNAAGRVPSIYDLHLRKGKVKYSKKGVAVNEYLQSETNPSVFAAGDTSDTQGMPLTPIANLEGHILASNIINGLKKTPDYSGTATAVFTIPTLAAVGLTEEEAHKKGLSFDVKSESAADWFNARRQHESIYAYKTLVDRKSGIIIGAHLIGPNVEETINIFALAIRSGIPAEELKKSLFAYPSMASDVPAML